MKLLKVIKRSGEYVFSNIDDTDFEKVKDIRWRLDRYGYIFWRQRLSNKQKTWRLHRVIMNAKDNEIVDHKDGNLLNNQRMNLRICSVKVNAMNIHKNKRNTSGYKGVSKCKLLNKWRANIGFNGRTISLGTFSNQIQAAKRYDKEAIKLFGEFACVNFLPSTNVLGKDCR
jgi:hypothetical protein